MLENFHLKSIFYPTNSSATPEVHTKPLSTLPEHNSSTQVSTKKISLSSSIKNSNSRQVPNYLEAISTKSTNPDDSFKEIKKLTENKSLKQSYQPLIIDSNLNVSFKHSQRTIKRPTLKRPSFIRHDKTCARPSSRVRTPCFKKSGNNEESIQELCEKLIVEQEIMKETIKKQQKTLMRLENVDCSYEKKSARLPKIFRFDFGFNSLMKKRRGDATCKNIAISSPVEFRSKTSLNSPVHGLQESETNLGHKYEDLNLSRSSKYHKDQPKIRVTLKFPMEVFTPKQ